MMAIFGASAPFPAVITVEVGESELVVLPRGDLSPGWFSFMTTIISGSLSSLSTSKICDRGTVDFGMLECAVEMALGDAVAGFWAISECTDVAAVAVAVNFFWNSSAFRRFGEEFVYIGGCPFDM